MVEKIFSNLQICKYLRKIILTPIIRHINSFNKFFTKDNKMKKLVLTALLASALVMTACTASNANPVVAQTQQAVQQNQLERNKANVLAFYDLAFNQHKLQEAVDKYIGKSYWQHNPSVGDGGQAFIDAFAPFLKENPQSRASVKRVIAEGDLVMVHVFSQTNPKDKGEAVVDIFRLDNDGKIVEHWDVIQPVPEKTVSGRGMF